MADLSCLIAARRLNATCQSILRTLQKADRRYASTESAASAAATISTRPSVAPKANIDVRHIRENPDLHEKNCNDRNYSSLAGNPRLIKELFADWQNPQHHLKHLRKGKNALLQRMKDGPEEEEKTRILLELKQLKEQIGSIEQKGDGLEHKIQELAMELPNLTSQHTPIGAKPQVLEYTNDHPDEIIKKQKSHVDIGTELDLLDIAAASTTSGWGFYYLKNEAALLEQALVQYALKIAREHGFQIVSPPSVVYSHISTACGFRPRDSGGEQQVYSIAQQEEDKSRPELSLAGTAEIPFAAMKASTDMDAAQLPLRIVGSSRCYRAEAGSRGLGTKGLYRVHEFTKVEMFGWTLPDGSEDKLFQLMMSVQKKILQSLGLHCRILEQPTQDLGASATRKQDIEAFFPSRRSRDDGWGEVTSTSICTEYQSRRLATRVKHKGKLVYPYTVNGTALAVPRVLAAILENHWDEETRSVHVPKVLQPWMHGISVIGPKS